MRSPLTASRSHGSGRPPGRLLALVLVAASVAACATTSDDARTRRDDRPPALCAEPHVRCATVDVPGLGAVRYGVVNGTGTRTGLVLAEIGGPGADVLNRTDLESLGLPPAVLANDILLIGEPWTGREFPASCEAAVTHFGAAAAGAVGGPVPRVSTACAPSVWSAATYGAALREIQRREPEPLVGIVGQSFGALPASAAASLVPTAWLVLNAPVAPPGTAGDDLIGQRTDAVHAALDRSYASTCGPSGLDCRRTGRQVVDDAIRRTRLTTVTGRTQPIGPGDVGLAVLAATYGLDANQDWLWTTLARLPGAGDAALLQIGRMADQILQRYDRGRVAPQLSAFVAGVCGGYDGWSGEVPARPSSPGALLALVAEQCAGVSQDAGWGAVRPRPLTCVFGNDLDPVAPGRWAAEWARNYGVGLLRYRENGHAGLARATTRVPGCAALN